MLSRRFCFTVVIVVLAGCAGAQEDRFSRTALVSSEDPPTIVSSSFEPAISSNLRGAEPSVVQLRVGVDRSALDPSVSPCDDFYAHACGGWMKGTPIPADTIAWSRGLDTIRDRNWHTLRTILERNAEEPPPSDPYSRALGDYYAACMDEQAIEANGLRDLEPLLALSRDFSGPDSFAMVLARLHEHGIDALFRVRAAPDSRQASDLITTLWQGGFGLPDRSYYLGKDAWAGKVRIQYQIHIAEMLKLAGDRPDEASHQAERILRIEAMLALASMSAADLREPGKVYHRVNLARLERMAPHVQWRAYFKTLGLDHIDAFNVAQPEFFQAVSRLVERVASKPEDWRSYLRWRVIDWAAPMLPERFVQQDFRFRSTMTGVTELTPRWKRCVAATEAAMGMALAPPFVDETLGAEGRTVAASLLAQIEIAMRSNLPNLAWMDTSTRERAEKKLSLITNHVGYPNQWRPYDGLAVERGSYLNNAAAAARFEARRSLATIGEPIDRDDWDTIPTAVEARYEPSRNRIVFPAGILQPPFFAADSDPSTNFGAIGVLMGRELTRGFDDEGRQFDGQGNLADGWTTESAKEFEKRTACLVSQFDGYEVLPGVPVNGRLTLRENLADLGGLKLAYQASADAGERVPDPTQDGFTPAQRFFLAFAQSRCTNVREAAQRRLVLTDPHPPPRFRVNGPLANLPEFAAAFSCEPGTRLSRPPEQRCEIW